MSAFQLEHLTVIGVGLIGGSLARALRQVCATVTGCGRSVANLELAQRMGVIDRYVTDVATAVKDADMIVVAVPLGAMANTFAAMRDHLRKEAIVTDAGSAKQSVVAAARTHLSCHLHRVVPGHPIAGAEKSGVAASRADLFVNHRVILTPLPETDPAACAKVRDMWTYCGAQVIEMDAHHHDYVLAATSHLPHVLAFALVDMLAALPPQDNVFQFAAGGFRDFTRIASSDTQMWHDICLANRDEILHMLANYQRTLQQFAHFIARGDSDAIKQAFAKAKQVRDAMYCA